jgi:uncharacterized protein (TIGR03663 family)
MKLHWLVILLAVGLALALRLPQLERRPMHTDEAVHAVRLGDMLERGTYDYDPHDYHGPTMYYATVPIAWLRGERTLWQLTATTMRFVPLLFGIGVILLLLVAGDTLGRTEVACAALLTAVSPFMVYFSRYYIMEMLFVFFTFALLLSVWRYWQTGKLAWAALAGVCMGLMHATKETCVITWFCLAVALIVAQASRLCGEPTHRRDACATALACIVAIVVSVTCFSVFFTDWRGVPQSVLTYLNYAKRGQGSGHEHPWYSYLEWFAWHRTGKLLWTEAAILVLAIIGSLRAFREQHGFGKLLAIYAGVMLVVYSVIPYKTPWSMLSLIHALILLAGIGIAGFPKWAAWPLLLAVAGHLAFQSVRANSARFECDERNPCVYSHTSRDAIRLSDRIHQIAAVSPDGKKMIVKFMSKEYWPMPWYLRDLPNVGYWDKPADPTGASIIISSPEFNLDFGDGWQSELFGLRPGVLLQVHIRRDLWQKFLETRK